MTRQPNSQDRFHSRGFLPHLSARNATQFVTFRLADSMPQRVLEHWREQLSECQITDVEQRKRIEQFLDSGYGACYLSDRRVAGVVAETLKKWDGEKYRLVAWVIMPNHVHILIELMDGHSLSDIMHSIKSFTAHAANKLLARSGKFWAVESFDRFIRDGRHFENVVRYIEDNPAKAGLCRDPEGWEFSSAYRSR